MAKRRSIKKYLFQAQISDKNKPHGEIIEFNVSGSDITKALAKAMAFVSVTNINCTIHGCYIYEAYLNN